MSPRTGTKTFKLVAGAAFALVALAAATSVAGAATLHHSQANLALRLSASAGTVNVGQQVTYTATVVNTGHRTDRNAGFRDVLPGKASFVSANASQGNCWGNQTVRCNFGRLARGASA